jgi:hypothetical protein
MKSGDNRGKTVGARINVAEERELISAADREGKNVSEWAREVLLREARRAKDDALFTEVVATRTLLSYMLRPLAMGEVLSLEEYVKMVNGVSDRKHETAREVMAQYTGKQAKGQ